MHDECMEFNLNSNQVIGIFSNPKWPKKLFYKKNIIWFSIFFLLSDDHIIPDYVPLMHLRLAYFRQNGSPWSELHFLHNRWSCISTHSKKKQFFGPLAKIGILNQIFGPSKRGTQIVILIYNTWGPLSLLSWARVKNDWTMYVDNQR